MSWDHQKECPLAYVTQRAPAQFHYHGQSERWHHPLLEAWLLRYRVTSVTHHKNAISKLHDMMSKITIVVKKVVYKVGLVLR